MPKIQRSGVPAPLLRHLLDRVRVREISLTDLHQFSRWIDGNPTVPGGPWFKSYGGVTIVGDGPLVKSLLRPTQSTAGTEVE